MIVVIVSDVVGAWATRFYRMAVGNFLFLRLFCPALVDSFEYGLMDSPPDTASLRLLVLISKVLQGIVTGSAFRCADQPNPTLFIYFLFSYFLVQFISLLSYFFISYYSIIEYEFNNYFGFLCCFRNGKGD
jgi:hypothetical protein